MHCQVVSVHTQLADSWSCVLHKHISQGEYRHYAAQSSVYPYDLVGLNRNAERARLTLERGAVIMLPLESECGLGVV